MQPALQRPRIIVFYESQIHTQRAKPGIAPRFRKEFSVIPMNSRRIIFRSAILLRTSTRCFSATTRTSAQGRLRSSASRSRVRTSPIEKPSRSISARSSAVSKAIIRRAVSAIVGPNSPLDGSQRSAALLVRGLRCVYADIQPEEEPLCDSKAFSSGFVSFVGEVRE